MNFDQMFMANIECTMQDLARKDELDAALKKYNDLFMEPKLILIERRELKIILDQIVEIDTMRFPAGDTKIRAFWEAKNRLLMELRGLLTKAIYPGWNKWIIP